LSTALAVQPQRQVSANQSGDDDDYFDLTRLRRQYNDWAAAKTDEGTEMVDARHYYHSDQWTKEEIRKLKDRGQPIVTSNRIVRKIDAIVGLVERLRQDVKAYPRTPKQDEGADLATATLRYQLDSSDWKSKSTRIARVCAIDGLSGIEYDLVPGDEGDPTLEMHIVYGDGFFYDPRSYDEGFTDARYMGVAKWMDVDQAKELFPDKAAEIDSLMDSGLGPDIGSGYRPRAQLDQHQREKGPPSRSLVYQGRQMALVHAHRQCRDDEGRFSVR
jgi:hypothetical protein